MAKLVIAFLVGTILLSGLGAYYMKASNSLIDQSYSYSNYSN